MSDTVPPASCYLGCWKCFHWCWKCFHSATLATPSCALLFPPFSSVLDVLMKPHPTISPPMLDVSIRWRPVLSLRLLFALNETSKSLQRTEIQCSRTLTVCFFPVGKCRTKTQTAFTCFHTYPILYSIEVVPFFSQHAILLTLTVKICFLFAQWDNYFGHDFGWSYRFVTAVR